MTRKIRRNIMIDGKKYWVSGDNEQDYANSIIRLVSGGYAEKKDVVKHDFREYARNWFEVFSKPNIEEATAVTYERQLNKHLFDAFDGMNIEDITPADVQRLFNGMSGAKETKTKAKNVLNMILQQAIEDGLIQKSPLSSRSIRITGRASKETEPYSVAQMQHLVGHIGDVERQTDRAYLALHALHPLRLEEVLGLRWRDIDLERMKINIEQVVTHPDRNRPIVKGTKTDASRRSIDLVPQVVEYLGSGDLDEYIIGGLQPMSYTMVRRMCERIRKQTGFDEVVSPRRFRTTVLTDIYDATKDIKQAQNAAGHTTAAMTLKHYVKGRGEHTNTATPIADAYGL